ncbi:MAG: ABC transporter permease subunit [Actinomycetota bacterium]|nr:ABC transporter permease subunit [Actinomycetota bacterium]
MPTASSRLAVARAAAGKGALVAGAVVTLGLVWTGYKAMGTATGGTWPGTSFALPVATDDSTLPPFLEIFTRFGQPQRTGDPFPLWQYLVDAAVFTFREAFVGFLAGVVIGLALAMLMLRSRWLERGLFPWVVVSQTVPLIALAPVVMAWGNKIQLPFGAWQPWMSVSVIATYLTFFPVAVNGLRGLTSPTALSTELMRSYAASSRATMVKLRLPSAVPYLIPALKLAATASVVGAIVGEISAGLRGGLGRLIIDYAQQYLTDPARLYCAVLAAGLLGVLCVGLVDGLDRLLMRHRPREAT